MPNIVATPWLFFATGSLGIWTTRAALEPPRGTAGALMAASEFGDASFAAVGIGFADALIAFCRPDGGTARPAEAPCFCSVEGTEVAITPGQFISHMRDRRAAGMTSAAELREAAQHARDICGASATAAPLDALGAPSDRARPSSTGRRTGPASPARAGAP